MTGTLVPVTKALSGIMDVTMVPWGNAYTNTSQCGRPAYDRDQVGCWRKLCAGPAAPRDCSSGPVLCQHGEDECLANRLEGCAFLNTEFPDWVPFVGCYEGNGDLSLQNARRCAGAHGINYAKMTACANGALGAKVDRSNALATLAYSGEWLGTPTVTVAGETVQDPGSGNNLLNAVCKAYTGHHKPSACK